MTNISTKGTILVVDDVLDNIKVLLELLTSSGYRVLVAKNGPAALEKANFARPDLILLDVMMLGMDGFETCQHLKSQVGVCDIPVIFMTALADVQDKIRGFSVGAVDYITKPIQIEEVLVRVETHLNLRRLRQQLEQELQVRRHYVVELEKRITELNIFSHTLAHDLKNPLSAILGFSELLLMEYNEKKGGDMEYIEAIQQSGQKMLEIIESLLLLAGVSSQKIELDSVDMRQILIQVTQHRLSDVLKEFQGELRMPEVWLPAVGYSPWIEEVWANYLSNGLKYGGKPPRLQLGCEPWEDRQVRFWVKDNGEGLSSAECGQLFVPFMRLHKGHTEGHGLGLSVVQQIIGQLGGQVGVESELGQGCLFYFTLPTRELMTV